MKKTILAAVACALTAVSVLPAYAQTKNLAASRTAPSHEKGDKQADPDPWWQHAVIYEIYPRSFADAKNSGMGNLKGITAKLDYLQSLGIDAIWITPCYPSPQVDFGYDISDYRNIAPEYGTLADFDELVAEAKKRKIGIIMDLVMNHTSDKHPWFIESKSSRINPKRNWYIWRDGKLVSSVGENLIAQLQPPNNWQSVFGHSAWKYDPLTRQYYYHFFYPEQPDLNWRNKDVRNAMYDVARFWLDRGAVGFRLDAITTLFEDPKLKDNPVLPGKNSYGDRNMLNKNNDRLPEVHDVLRGLRSVVNEYPGERVLVGECAGKDITELSCMYGKNADEIQLPMNFFFADVNKLAAPLFRKEIAAWDANPACGWPVYLFSNHDQVRHYIRYGNGKDNDQIAKLMATLLLTLRGTPILYYGEEIGMENNDPTSKDQVQDPIGKIGWPTEKGRDGERTPMQWTADANAGFSQVKPWLPVPASYKQYNVAVEEKDPHSILNYYKKLIALRRTNEALVHGDYIALNETDDNVLSYLRQSKEGAVIVALNMSDKPATMRFDLKEHGVSGNHAKILAANYASTGEPEDLARMSLPPYGAIVGQVVQ